MLSILVSESQQKKAPWIHPSDGAVEAPTTQYMCGLPLAFSFKLKDGFIVPAMSLSFF